MTLNPPADLVLAEFGVTPRRGETLRKLAGGRGLTWRVGDTVLRPSAADGETSWKAAVLAELAHTDAFRTPRPIVARSGSWSVDGWEAWQWVPGGTDESRVDEVRATGAAFHEAIRELRRPGFLDVADDPWARSDRIAWEEAALPRERTLERLADAFAPVTAPSQMIHGDLLGNVMFAQGHPPSIIDWAPYWRPAGFADAIVLADAACWHGLDVQEMRRSAEGVPEGRQLLIRALVFRIATFHLLGRWDAQMEAHHEAAIEVALT